MTTTNFFSKVGFVLAIAAVAILPQISFAASYAYVTAAGNVSMVVANDPNTALAIAPGIHNRSGVMLLTSQTGDGIVGDSVSGM